MRCLSQVARNPGSDLQFDDKELVFPLLLDETLKYVYLDFLSSKVYKVYSIHILKKPCLHQSSWTTWYSQDKTGFGIIFQSAAGEALPFKLIALAAFPAKVLQM